jgi:hypothetical protein
MFMPFKSVPVMPINTEWRQENAVFKDVMTTGWVGYSLWYLQSKNMLYYQQIYFHA